MQDNFRATVSGVRSQIPLKNLQKPAFWSTSLATTLPNSALELYLVVPNRYLYIAFPTVSNRIPSAKPSTNWSWTGLERVPTKHADHILSNHPQRQKMVKNIALCIFFSPSYKSTFPLKALLPGFFSTIPTQKAFSALAQYVGQTFFTTHEPGFGAKSVANGILAPSFYTRYKYQ